VKILRIAQEIFPEVVGGGAYHAHALSRDQAAMGHSVTVLSISDQVDEITEQYRSQYQLIKVPASATLLSNDISLSAMRYLADNFDDYDVVHSHAHFYFASNVAALLSHFSEVPMAMTNHSLISQSVPEWIARLHLKTIGKYTFNRAEVIFCYTDEERRRFDKHNIDSDVRVISNGVDQSQFSPGGDPSTHIDTDRPAVLFVGRLVDGKRPQDAIDAFADLHDTHDDAVLYICGEGPLRDSLESRVADHGIQNAVEFLGLVDYDVMPSIYRDSDILLLPSRSEGFPRTLMEALSTETPVIATELSQTKAITEQGGIVVPQGDVGAMAGALESLVTDDQRREGLGETGREVLAQQGLTWESTVEETTRQLQTLAQQDRSAQSSAISPLGSLF